MCPQALLLLCSFQPASPLCTLCGAVAQKMSLNRMANELLVCVLKFQEKQQSPCSTLSDMNSLYEITERRRAAEIKDLASAGKH